MSAPLTDAPATDAPPTGAQLSRIAVLLVSALLVLVAFAPGPVQDLASLRTGAALAGSAPGDVYLSDEPTSLFDVTPGFLAASLRDDPTRPPAATTGFVSAPPVLLVPFDAFPWRIARVAWRLLAAVACAFALFRLHDRVVPVPARTSFALLAVLCFPVLAYGVWLGQTSWLWLLAAALLAERRGHEDVREGVVVGVLALLKATPALLLVPLVLRGRRRAVGAAMAVGAVAIVASLILLPPSLWVDFVRASSSLSTRVIPDWNVGSVEALLVRADAGTHSRLTPIPAAAAALAWAFRIALGIALVRTRRTDVALLAAWSATPLLWTHYLAAAPALLAPAVAARPGPVLLVGGLVGASVLALLVLPPAVVGGLSSLAFAGTAFVVLTRRPGG